MSAHIRVRNLQLEVPAFMQRDRDSTGWLSTFLGAAFDPPRRQVVRLLDNVSFDIKEGDRLAILGRNGAGKSTLLRVLNGVYRPTRGSLEVSGTCQALLNLSLGFNNEATVRENILLRGVAMGLPSSFLRTQIGPILHFAGLEQKASHRLRTLSSGQRMRLGFAISTSVQHDIMLMDEWVGAGDQEFMTKAKERMRDRIGGSKIVVLASHSVGLLRDICNKGIVLERGRLLFAGDITSALHRYHTLISDARELAAVGNEDEDEVTAQVYGTIEAIEHLGDGRFLVKGWMVDTDGGVPGSLSLEVQGHRHLADTFEQINRSDVASHLGLIDSRCGFHAVFSIAGVSGPGDLGSDLRVLGGSAPGVGDAALRLAKVVMDAVGQEA